MKAFLPPEKRCIFSIMFLHSLKALVQRQNVHHDGHSDTLDHIQNSVSEDKVQVGEGGLLHLYHSANDHARNFPYPGYQCCVQEAILPQGILMNLHEKVNHKTLQGEREGKGSNRAQQHRCMKLKKIKEQTKEYYLVKRNQDLHIPHTFSKIE